MADDDREYEEYKAQRAARRLTDAVKQGIKELIEEGELELDGGDEGESGGKKKTKAKKKPAGDSDDDEQAPKRGKGVFSDYGL